MARQKIGEYKAKKIVYDFLSLPYYGIFIDSPTDSFSKLNQLEKDKRYVVKVDQGIKKRYKQGLIKLDISVSDIPDVIELFQEKGYSKFLIEEYKKYDKHSERYLAIERQREGLVLCMSERGGVDVEEYGDSLKIFPATSHNYAKISKLLGLDEEMISKLIALCDKYHFSLLEINPLVVVEQEILFLDMAVEVDSAGAFFVHDAWTEEDYILEQVTKTEEEVAVLQLSQKSQASFRLVVLNPDGALWMLLSGGGASIVVADEVYNRGEGKELANYGEYSGNPNAEETYLYTKSIVSLLLKSKAPKKALIIAGGVANFTDIRITFSGICKALLESLEELQKQRVKVYVRRGGPYQEEGLMMMKEFLEENSLYGSVSGPDQVLTDVVVDALAGIKS